MKVDIIIMVLVAGLLALPLYVTLFDPSKAFADALALAWIADAVACFAVLFIETFRKN